MTIIMKLKKPRLMQRRYCDKPAKQTNCLDVMEPLLHLDLDLQAWNNVAKKTTRSKTTDSFAKEW